MLEAKIYSESNGSCLRKCKEVSAGCRISNTERTYFRVKSIILGPGMYVFTLDKKPEATDLESGNHSLGQTIRENDVF